MTQDNLIEYIKEQKAAGYSSDAIRKVLRENGWPDDATERAFQTLSFVSRPQPVESAVAVAAPVDTAAVLEHKGKRGVWVTILTALVIMGAGAVVYFIYGNYASQVSLQGEYYKSSNMGFKIRLPEGWQVNNNIGSANKESFGNLQSGSKSSITVSTEIFNDKLASFETFAAIYTEALKKSNQFELKKSNQLAINGHSAFVNLYDVEILGLKLTYLDVFLLDSGIVYRITGITEQSDWGKIGESISASIMTFELI